MIALEPGDAGAFMQRLGPAIDAAFGRPKAIVSVSAHTAARVPVVLGAARHEAIYDFGNFDRRLNEMRYDAPGDPALATRMTALLRAAGIDAQQVDEGGLDHGAWTALRYIYPDADIPIVPLAFVPGDPPAQAVRARRGPRVAGRRGRARPRQRQHHAQPAAGLQRRRPASRQGAAGDPGERGLPPLVRRARGGARLGRALRLSRPGAACRRHASDRRAPAALVRGRRRRRPRASRRCASTPARPWAASAWTPTRSARTRRASPRRSPRSKLHEQARQPQRDRRHVGQDAPG